MCEYRHTVVPHNVVTKKYEIWIPIYLLTIDEGLDKTHQRLMLTKYITYNVHYAVKAFGNSLVTMENSFTILHKKLR